MARVAATAAAAEALQAEAATEMAPEMALGLATEEGAAEAPTMQPVEPEGAGRAPEGARGRQRPAGAGALYVYRGPCL